MAGRGTDIKLGAGVVKCQVCGIRSAEPAFGQLAEKEDLEQDQVKALGCYVDPPAVCRSSAPSGTSRGASTASSADAPAARAIRARSQFFLSLEDDLMRLFGTDRIARVMDRLGAEEGEVITHPW